MGIREGVGAGFILICIPQVGLVPSEHMFAEMN